MRHASGWTAASAWMLSALPVTAADVVRVPLPGGSAFPIAAAVEVPAGKSLVFVSGTVPGVADAKADRSSMAAYGDTRTQTVSVLNTIKATLAGLQLSLGDVVKMQVFLVGDPARGGHLDFDGFMQGYRQFFGTPEQPKLPARTAMQVAALANPGYLVEIEVIAVRP